jgi:hypothetical protein
VRDSSRTGRRRRGWCSPDGATAEEEADGVLSRGSGRLARRVPHGSVALSFRDDHNVQSLTLLSGPLGKNNAGRISAPALDTTPGDFAAALPLGRPA